MYFLLLIFWFILNGKITAELIVLGMIICALLYLFIYKFMDYDPKTELAVFKCIFKLIRYAFLLIKEVISSNIATAKCILDFEKEPDPMLLEFDMDFKTETAKTMLANSITLTPGTITVNIDDNTFLVHGLKEDFLEGIEASDFVTQIHEIENCALNNIEKN